MPKGSSRLVPVMLWFAVASMRAPDCPFTDGWLMLK